MPWASTAEGRSLLARVRRDKNGKLYSYTEPNLEAGETEDDEDADVVDCMTYRVEVLDAWRVFTMIERTVWDNPSIWLMTLRLVGFSMLVAMVVVLAAQEPQKIKPMLFSEISDFLLVFVALLLSFFLTSAVRRWSECVHSILNTIHAIRDLQMQFLCLNVPKEEIEKLMRYGVVSVRLLHAELVIAELCKSEQLEAKEVMWEDLANEPEPLTKLSAAEVRELQQVADEAGVLWVWFGTGVGRLSKAGKLPAMHTPTYSRIMRLVQQAEDGIRYARAAITVQTPFVYVHTLSVLVHINNILSAVSFGLAVGSAGAAAVRHDPAMIGGGPEATSKQRLAKLWIQFAESIVIQGIKMFVGCLLYQAFLEIGISIAAPFSSDDGEIPVRRLVRQLCRALHDAQRLADKPPSWEEGTIEQEIGAGPPQQAAQPQAAPAPEPAGAP